MAHAYNAGGVVVVTTPSVTFYGAYRLERERVVSADHGGRGVDGRDDESLMRDIAAGDDSALGAFYDRYANLVYSLCLRIVRSRDDADELLVDIFWEIWNRSARYDPSRSKPLTYLMTLTRSRAIDRKRAMPKLKTQDLDVTDSAATRTAVLPEAGPLLDEARIAVAKSLAGLDENQRKAIEYSFWDDMSHSEIAAKVNKPLGTVKTWIRQGLSKMRHSLKAMS